MKSKIFLFMLTSILHTAIHAQSPWVGKKGSFYGQVSFTYLGYSNIIGDRYNKIEETDFKTRDITTSLYADYSVSDKVAIIASLPYKMVQHDGQRLSSAGDPTVKVKYQLLDEVPVAGYVGYTAPFSKREGILRTGYNQHAVEVGFSVGKGKASSFMYGGLGYRNRTNISNQVLVEFEYGRLRQIANRPFYTVFRLDGMLNISDVEDNESAPANLYHNNGEFLSPAVKFSYNAFSDFWVNMGIHSAVLVRNFGAASTLNLGFAYKGEK